MKKRIAMYTMYTVLTLLLLCVILPADSVIAKPKAASPVPVCNHVHGAVGCTLHYVGKEYYMDRSRNPQKESITVIEQYYDKNNKKHTRTIVKSRTRTVGWMADAYNCIVCNTHFYLTVGAPVAYSSWSPWVIESVKER